MTKLKLSVVCNQASNMKAGPETRAWCMLLERMCPYERYLNMEGDQILYIEYCEYGLESWCEKEKKRRK
jgi:hypothetical protein